MKPLPTNVASLSAADIISRLLGFLAVAYLARILGAANMGILAAGTAILAYASVFADAGLPILGTRSAAQESPNLFFLVKRIYSARMVLSMATVVLGAGLLTILVKDSTIRLVALIFLLSLLPSALFLDWLFQGLNKMTTLATGRILGMAVYLLFIIAFVSGQSSLFLVPVGWILGNIGQASFFWRSFKKSNGGGSVSSFGKLRIAELIRQGIPLGVANLISRIVLQFPLIYIAFFDSPQDAGIYSVAFRVIVLLLMLDRVFYTIFLPVISRSFKDGLEQLRRRFNRTLRFVSVSVFYVATISIFLGDTILPIIFGPEFRDSGQIFQLLMVYFVLTVLNSTFTFTIIAVEREKVYTRSLLVGALGFFGIVLLPLPLSTALVAPVGLAIYQAISLLILIRETQEMMPVNILRPILGGILAEIALLFALSIVNQQSALLAALAAVVITAPILSITVGITKDDLRFLKQTLL